MLRLLVAAGLLLLPLGLACGATEQPKRCRAETCQGCCSADDRCQDGTSKAACGYGAVACAVCDLADYCVKGACSSEPSCKSAASPCTVSDECCVGLICSANKCSGTTCKETGSCTANGDCCSGQCAGTACVASSSCNDVGGACSPCCKVGLVCSLGYCRLPSGGGGGGGGGGCAPLNGQCSSVQPCCGQYTCQGGTCRP